MKPKISKNIFPYKRYICVYPKNGIDLISDIDISFIKNEELKKIITVHKDDPLIIDPYLLNNKQLKILSTLSAKLNDYNFEKYEYYIETFKS